MRALAGGLAITLKVQRSGSSGENGGGGAGARLADDIAGSWSTHDPVTGVIPGAQDGAGACSAGEVFTRVLPGAGEGAVNPSTAVHVSLVAVAAGFTGRTRVYHESILMLTSPKKVQINKEDKAGEYLD